MRVHPPGKRSARQRLLLEEDTTHPRARLGPAPFPPIPREKSQPGGKPHSQGHLARTGTKTALCRSEFRREALDREKLLLPTEITRGDPRLAPLTDEIRQMRMIIPAVEALYIGQICTTAFSGYLLTAFGEMGGYLFQEVDVGADAFRILSQASTELNGDNERHTAERHARGNPPDDAARASSLDPALASRPAKTPPPARRISGVSTSIWCCLHPPLARMQAARKHGHSGPPRSQQPPHREPPRPHKAQ